MRDAKDVIRRRKSLLKYGRLRGLNSNYLEDFASESLLKFIEGRQATNHQFYVDFMRDNFEGRYGQKHNYSFALYEDRSDHEKHGEEKPYLKTEENPLVNLEIEALFKNLKLDKRIIYILRNHWGMSESEIAFVFGLTESRICQILKEVTRILKKRTAPD